jgi:hypothetical protein
MSGQNAGKVLTHSANYLDSFAAIRESRGVLVISPGPTEIATPGKNTAPATPAISYPGYTPVMRDDIPDRTIQT